MKQASVRRLEAAGVTSGLGYFQAAQAKLIHCLRASRSFILGMYSDLRRQAAELIADVPAALQAVQSLGPQFQFNANNYGHHEAVTHNDRGLIREALARSPVAPATGEKRSAWWSGIPSGVGNSEAGSGGAA